MDGDIAVDDRGGCMTAPIRLVCENVWPDGVCLRHGYVGRS